MYRAYSLYRFSLCEGRIVRVDMDIAAVYALVVLFSFGHSFHISSRLRKMRGKKVSMK